MKAVSYSEFRENLKTMLDVAEENHIPLIIKRQGGRDMVVMSLEDYNGHIETMYLLSDQKNREHLERSIRQGKQGFKKTFSIEELNRLFDEKGIV